MKVSFTDFLNIVVPFMVAYLLSDAIPHSLSNWRFWVIMVLFIGYRGTRPWKRPDIVLVSVKAPVTETTTTTVSTVEKPSENL